MKSGVYVRAKKDGTWQTVDILELTDESFRVFTMQMLARTGSIAAIASEIDTYELTARDTPAEAQPEDPVTE